MPRYLPVVLLVAACLGLGCGAKSPKSQFIADGDEICRELAPRFERLEPGVTPTPGALLGISVEYRELTRALSERLAARRPPGYPRAARIVAAAARLASAARRQKVITQRIAAARSRAEELRGYGAFWPTAQRTRDRYATTLDRLMRGYGFTGCTTVNGFGVL